MWKKLIEFWHNWRAFSECAMETVNPPELDEAVMNQSFLENFACLVKSAYEDLAPGFVRLISVSSDPSSNCLFFNFIIDHNRKIDEISLRWHEKQVTVEFQPGGAITNTICFKDLHSLRWIMLDQSKTCIMPTSREKTDVESISANIHSIAQHYRPQLKFIIGHSAKVRTKGEKF